jgi:hypothetical protein
MTGNKTKHRRVVRFLLEQSRVPFTQPVRKTYRLAPRNDLGSRPMKRWAAFGFRCCCYCCADYQWSSTQPTLSGPNQPGRLGVPFPWESERLVPGAVVVLVLLPRRPRPRLRWWHEVGGPIPANRSDWVQWPTPTNHNLVRGQTYWRFSQHHSRPNRQSSHVVCTATGRLPVRPVGLVKTIASCESTTGIWHWPVAAVAPAAAARHFRRCRLPPQRRESRSNRCRRCRSWRRSGHEAKDGTMMMMMMKEKGWLK